MAERMIPPATLAECAKKVEEAAGLLAMLKPFCKRPKTLTQAEQDSFESVIGNASRVLNAANRMIFEARYEPAEEVRALRKA